MLPIYSRVRLITDKYQSEGALNGMLGYIIELRGTETYEVEFSDPTTGETVAQVVLDESEVALSPEGS